MFADYTCVSRIHLFEVLMSLRLNNRWELCRSCCVVFGRYIHADVLFHVILLSFMFSKKWWTGTHVCCRPSPRLCLIMRAKPLGVIWWLLKSFVLAYFSTSSSFSSGFTSAVLHGCTFWVMNWRKCYFSFISYFYSFQDGNGFQSSGRYTIFVFFLSLLSSAFHFGHSFGGLSNLNLNHRQTLVCTCENCKISFVAM